jgi:protein SCO1/2
VNDDGTGVSEERFAEMVEAIRLNRQRWPELVEFLRDDQPIYHQRGAAATVRMRGWVFLAIARTCVSEEALGYLLEELDNGRDAYLIAAAAKALRSYEKSAPEFAPFLGRALRNIRFHDDLISLEEYGGYPDDGGGTTALRELLETVRWMGPAARTILPDVEALRDNVHDDLSKDIAAAAAVAAEAIRAPVAAEASCCLPLNVLDGFRALLRVSRKPAAIADVEMEDQDGNVLHFGEFFRHQPSIVAFFYTRCSNPQRCSLTITKLARVQEILEREGLAARIRTAGITYDPAFDGPPRLRSFGEDRGMRFGERSRLLRTPAGFADVKAYFGLGVSFIETLVNRHRVEVYLLDAEGRVAASFARIQWDEARVVREAAKLLEEGSDQRRSLARSARSTAFVGATGAASLLMAFFPKCPMCWAAYLSMFGIASVQNLPYVPSLFPVLIGLLVVHLGSLWWRGRVQRRMAGFNLALIGSLLILLGGIGFNSPGLAICGVVLNTVGTATSVFGWDGLRAARR